MTDSPYSVSCPMPECTEDLYITYSGSYGILPDDPAKAEQINPEDAHAQEWKVECAAGHVLLVPGPSGCDCNDHDEGDPCPIEELFDWGDEHEHRTFRQHDWARLNQVLVPLRQMRDLIERAEAVKSA